MRVRDDLDDVVVLPDVHAVLLGALEGDAGAAHLRHAEGVVGLDAEHVLDALARVLGVRLGADHEGAELGVLARVDALLAHHLIQACGIGRDGVHDGGAEVGGGDGQHADLLGAVLEAEAAGEHPVAGGVLEHVFRTAAHHPQAAGYGVGPFFQVLLRMQDDGGITGGAAGGMQADALVKRNSGHAERIGFAEVLLGGERNLLEVIERPDIRRGQSGLAETLPVERRIHAVLDRGFQPLELVSLYF